MASAGRTTCSRCLAAGLLAVTAASGCDLRDEAVRAAGETGVWPASAGPAGGGDAAVGAAAMGYVPDYGAAARRAAAEGRPLVVVFGASWCRWSGELARGPLADPAVVARTRACVCTFVDADRDPATCRAFGVAAFPTVIVIDPAGHERFRAAGGTAAADGLATALDALAAAGTAPPRTAADPPDAGSAITR